MECPHCGLINPNTAQSCDCGYEFKKRILENSYLKQSPSSSCSILADDVRAAWSGVDMFIPDKFGKDPSNLIGFFGIVLLCLSIISAMTIEDEYSIFTVITCIVASFAIVMAIIAGSIYKKKYNTRASYYYEMNNMIAGEVKKFRRGYSFIGKNYRRWLVNGITSLQNSIIEYLNLSYSDKSPLAVEIHLEPAIPDVITISPRIYNNMAEAYPLPKQVGCTFYFLTPKMLIICPIDGVRISSINTGVLQNFVQKIQEVAADQGVNMYKPSMVVDIESTSLSCAQFPDAPSIVLLPDHLSSYELYLQEMVNIEYIQSTNKNTSSIVVTMRDGRQIKIPGNQKISDLLRLTLRDYKTAQPNILTAELGVEQSSLSTEQANTANLKVCPMCAEEVKAAAKICRFCAHKFEV